MRRLVLEHRTDPVVVEADFEAGGGDDDVGVVRDAAVLGTRAVDLLLDVAVDVVAQRLGQPPELAVLVALGGGLPLPDRSWSWLGERRCASVCGLWLGFGRPGPGPALGVEEVPVQPVGAVEFVGEREQSMPTRPSESIGGLNGLPCRTSRLRDIAIAAWIEADSGPVLLCGSCRRATRYSAPDSSSSSYDGSITVTSPGFRSTSLPKKSPASVRVAESPAQTNCVPRAFFSRRSSIAFWAPVVPRRCGSRRAARPLGSAVEMPKARGSSGPKLPVQRLGRAQHDVGRVLLRRVPSQAEAPAGNRVAAGPRVALEALFLSRIDRGLSARSVPPSHARAAQVRAQVATAPWSQPSGRRRRRTRLAASGRTNSRCSAARAGDLGRPVSSDIPTRVWSWSLSNSLRG